MRDETDVNSPTSSCWCKGSGRNSRPASDVKQQCMTTEEAAISTAPRPRGAALLALSQLFAPSQFEAPLSSKPVPAGSRTLRRTSPQSDSRAGNGDTSSNPHEPGRRRSGRWEDLSSGVQPASTTAYTAEDGGFSPLGPCLRRCAKRRP